MKNSWRSTWTRPLAIALLSGCIATAGCAPPVDDSETVAATESAFSVLIPAPELTGVVWRNQDDVEVSADDLRGKPALLTFIYTRCPMPQMCPATMLRLQQVQAELSVEERRGLRIIAVSFDPADTPEVLAEYGALWEADTSFFSLLTGTPENVLKLAGAYGAWFEKAEGEVFDHTMLTLLLNSEGSVVEILTGSMWSSASATQTLRALAAEESGHR